jgi:phosphopantetheine--protein transferase-like protein
MAFDFLTRDALPHGVYVGISLPVEPEPAPDKIMARLHPEEEAFARTLSLRRQCEFVGGRLAARAAIKAIGRKPGPVMRDNFGAPVAPRGISLSISHKGCMAVALVARGGHGVLGVDLEDLSPARLGVASRVLTEAERAAISEMDEANQWTEIVQRFAIKEAIYKALAPRLRRHIAFHEAEVHPHPDGLCSIDLMLAKGEPPQAIEGRIAWLGDRLLATVRAKWQ